MRRPERGRVAVRMEAIGGQGANSAGKILAEAAVLGMGFPGNHYSSFGSEKRGSPVRSFVRFSPDGSPVRTASSIHQPDLLVIFHASLLATHPECLEGAGPETDILIHTSLSPDSILFPIGSRFRRVATVDALALAEKNNCGINVVLLGAMAGLCPEVDGGVLAEVVERFFPGSLNGYRAGAKKVNVGSFHPRQAREMLPPPSLPRLGWANAPIGGVVPHPGNTALRDVSVSRKGTLPRLLTDTCYNCGYCDMVCPDYAFVWGDDPGKPGVPLLLGVDYQYCKGCLKCVEACPVEALVPIDEEKLPDEESEFKRFPSLSGAKKGSEDSE